MVNRSLNALEEPIMGHLVHREDRVRQGGVANSSPAGDQYTPPVRAFERAQHDICQLLGVGLVHAAETDIHGRRSRIEKVGEFPWRLPLAKTLKEPVAGDV